MKTSKGSVAIGTAILLVIGTSAVGARPILDAETGRGARGAILLHSAAYTMLAPFCGLLDALTLLSLRQHYAVLLTVIAVVAIWRIALAVSRGTTFLNELRAAGLTLAGIVIVYGGGAIVPRPMAALTMVDTNDVIVDFHSHTNYSWDARQWFTARRNRDWHAAAGFDVAYISDHKTMLGAEAALPHNPAHAGDGTTLLPAIEARDQYQHVIALGIDTSFAYDKKGDWHDPVGDTGLVVKSSPPILILTIPGNLSKIPPNELNGYARLVGVELSDGAPKGIGMIQQRKADILKFADTLNLAVVAGSDNHGWGSTAAGWSVMRIPNWFSMRPAQLDSAIQGALRIERRHAVRVYVRDSPDPGTSVAATAFTAPLVIWRTLVDLDWPERFAWLGWIVLIASIATMLRSRAARDTIPLAARRKPEST